ncbi:MAG: hypothetical protein RSG07_02455 [Erysipelotrichaceae bacterium]
MLGRIKKRKVLIYIFLIFILVFLFLMYKNQNSNYDKIEIEDNINNYLSLNDSSNALIQNKYSDDPFEKAMELKYPKDINFVPAYLNDQNYLFGEIDLSNDRTDIGIGSYNLEKNEFRILEKIHMKSKYASIGIVIATDKAVIYEETDQQNGVSDFYLYDLTLKKSIKLHSIKEIPPIHYSNADSNNFGIMLNFYTKDGYNNYFYSYDNKELVKIENENCGFPVYCNNLWYYVLIDNKKKTTELIEFDMINSNKRVLYKTVEKNNYISGVYSNGIELFLLMQNGEFKDIYEVDLKNKTMNIKFKDSWIESLVLNQNFMSWLGKNELPDRKRPQFHFINLNEFSTVSNEDGKIFLSNNGIAKINYKKSDVEIPKGKIYMNDNSSIYFKKLRR